jgi:F-type H+-transporting ATPase subunit epsilon
MDDSPRKLRIAVISPTEVGFEGTGDSVIVPAHDGLMGILYGHAPLMTLVGTGDVTVREGSSVRRIPVSGGFLQVVDNEISVLTEEVGKPTASGETTGVD